MNILKGTPSPLRLALRTREAAEAIGVSERTLWTWTQQGDVPFIKRGKATLYPIRELTAWLSSQVQRSPAEEAARLVEWHKRMGIDVVPLGGGTTIAVMGADDSQAEGGAR
ncbi:MAG: helix-turn-helix domain-containing protein [Phycisphaerae bacterium]|nr:helix-turn-helix domain-containing protein [Phycisphaerae bacterium]